MVDTTQLHDFIVELLRRKGDVHAVGANDALVVSGRLDSVDVMEIVVYLEDTFGIDFSERGIDVDDFDTLASMQALIEETTGGRST